MVRRAALAAFDVTHLAEGDGGDGWQNPLRGGAAWDGCTGQKSVLPLLPARTYHCHVCLIAALHRIL